MWSLVVLAALAACGAYQETGAVDPIAATGPITFAAENRRTDDVVVTLVSDGVPQRLGLVTAQGSKSFQVPWSQVSNGGRVRLVATPIAGRRSFVSEQLILRPGSEVSVSLTPLLNQSLVRVY
jgi:hypothetical protein